MAEPTTAPNSQQPIQKISVHSGPAQPLKLRALDGVRYQFVIDGVVYTGQKTIRGKAIRLERAGDALVLQLEGQTEPVLQITDFFNSQSSNTVFYAAEPFDSVASADTPALDTRAASVQGLNAFAMAPTSSSGSLLAIAGAGVLLAGAGGSSSKGGASISPADTIAPALAVSSDASNAVHGTVTYSFVFTERVFGFDVSKLSLTGGTLSGFTAAGDGLHFTVQATPDAHPSGSMQLTLTRAGVTDAAGNVATVPSVGRIDYTQNVLHGTIVAGPVIEGNQLSVKVFDASGQLLGNAAVDAAGNYRIGLGNHSGPVTLLVVDSGSGVDYVNELTRAAADLTDTLMAAYNVTGTLTDQWVNINPVTTIAALHAGLQATTDGQAITASIPPMDAQVLAGHINSANTAVALALGLGSSGDAVLRGSVVATVDSSGMVNTQANAYGKIIAALAGVDANQGTLSAIASAISAEGVLDPGIQASLVDGAAAAGLPYTVIPGVVAPTVQGFAVVDTTTANGATLGRVGETLSITVTLSEAVSSTDSLVAHFLVNGQDVTASASAVSHTNTLTFSATVPDADGTAISLTSLAPRTGVIRSDASHVSLEIPASGALAYGGYTADSTSPDATLLPDLFNNAHSAVVQSSEGGMAYLVNTAVTVRTVADISSSADRLWNSAAIGAANTPTHLAAAGLSDGSYRLYTTDAAGNLSLAASNTVAIDSTAPALTTGYSADENTSSDLALRTIALSGNDANGPVVWSQLAGSDAASFSLTAGSLRFNRVANFEAQSSYSVSVTASDAAGNASTQTLTINLLDLNEAPVAVGAIAAQNMVVGTAYTLDAGAYFADPDTLASVASGHRTLTYSLTSGSLPSGLTLDATTGVISGTPNVAAQQGSYTLTASDGPGLTASQTFSLVSAHPTVQSISVLDTTGANGSTLGKAGETLHIEVSMSEAVSSTDALTAHFLINGQDVTATAAAVTGASTITFSATVPVGDGTDISLTSLSVNNAGSISSDASHATLTPPTPAALSYSGYTVDNTSPTASVTPATLMNTADAVVQSTEAGTAYLVNTAVSVSSLSDITGAATDQWASVSIGAAHSDTPLSAAGLADGSYRVYTVDVAGNLSAPSTDTITIDTTAPTLSTSYSTAENAGSDTTLHTIHLLATEANGSVSWSGLSGTDAASMSLSGDTLSFAGSTNYESRQSYSVRVTGTDAAGNASTQTITINLTDVNEAPAAVGSIASQTTGVGVSYQLDTSAYFADPDTLASLASGYHALSYSVTRGSLPNGLTLDATTGIISGTPSASAVSTSYTITATDGGALSASQAFALQVLAPPTVQSFTVVDTTAANGSTLGKAGESLRIEVTLSEAVSSTDALTAHFLVNGQDVTATAAAVTGASTITFSATVPVGDGTDISLTSLSVNNAGSISSDASHATLTAPTPADISYSAYTVDNTSPTASVTAATLMNTADAVVQSTEVGTAYLVHTAVTVNNVNDITGAPSNQWNSVAIGAANSDTPLSAAGLADGSYKVYTVDAAGKLSAASSDTVTIDTTAPTLSTSYSTAENAGSDTTLHTIHLLATEANGSVSWSGLSGTDAASMSLSGDTLSFAGSTNYESRQSYSVRVTGTDAAGNASTQTITINLTDVNEAPAAVGSIASQTTAMGTAYSLDTSSYFTDPDTRASLASGYHTLTYSLTHGSLPNGLSLDANTGVISGVATAALSSASYTITASDGGGLSVTQTFALQVLPRPIVQSFTVADTEGANGTSLGQAGETLSIDVTLSEAVSSTDSLTAHFLVNGQDVIATAAQVSASNTIAFTATVPSGDGTAISLTSLTVNNGGTLSSDLSGGTVSAPVAGNISYSSYTVDNTGPTASVTADTLMNTGSAVVQSTEVGTAYLVHTAVTVNNVNDITGAPSNQWNSVAIGAANSDTTLSAAGLADGSYKVYTVDAAGKLSAASSDTITMDTTAPHVVAQTTGAILDNWNLSLTFSESVHGGSGNIVIHCVDDNTDRTIDVTDTSQVSINGNTVTINPSADLVPSAHYYVLVDAGTFTDTAGNDFAGLSSSADWAFHTASPSTTINLGGDADGNYKINASELTSISLSGVAEGIAGHAHLTVQQITFHPIDNSGDLVITTNLAVDPATGLWTLANDSSWTSQLTSGKTYQVQVRLEDTTEGGNALGQGTASASYLVDTAAPTASVTTDTLMNTGSAVVQSTEVGTAYLVNANVTVATLSDITGAAADQWNSVAIGTPGSDTNLSASGLADGNYAVYTVDAAGNLSLASTDTVTIDTTAPTLTTSYSTAENAGSDTTPHTIHLLGADAHGSVSWSNLSGADAAFFSLSGSDLVFNGASNFESKPSYSIRLTGTDAVGNASTQTLSIQLTDVNEAPTVVGSIAAQTAGVGVAYTLDASSYFADPDTTGSASYRTLSYSITSGSLPDGLTLDATTGIISGTPSGLAANASYTITATDLGGLGGGLSTSQTFSLQVTQPTVQSFTVVDTMQSNGTTLGQVGETLRIEVSLSEAVTSSDALTAHFLVNDQDLTATAAAVAGANTITFTATVPGGDGADIRLTSLSVNNAGSITSDASHAALVAPTPSAIRYNGYTVDNTGPTASVATATIMNSANAVVQSTEVGTAYLVNTSVTVNILGDITSAAGDQWTSAAISAINSDTNLVASGLADGSYVVYTVDAAGNLSAASSNTVTIDTTAPTASVAAATIMNSANAVVQSTEVGTAYLVNTSVTVNILGDITSAAGDQWTSAAISAINSDTNLAATGLVDGSYKVYTVDAAGNLSAASGNTVTIDTTAPTASVAAATIMNSASAVVQSTEVGTAYLVNTNVTVSSLGDITSAARDQWNSDAISSANSNTNLAATGLADGSYKVYTVDTAGNLSAASGNTVTIDTTAPTASVAAATIMNSANAVVQSTEVGTAYLVNTNVTVNSMSDITSAAADQWNSVAISSANSNTNLAATGLADGSYKVYTVDAAGNLSQVSGNTVTVDTTAPTASVTNATLMNTASAVVQSTEVGTAYLVNTSVNASSLGDITSAAGDQWNSVAISSANSNTNLAATGLADGSYKVYTVDAAGNLSQVSGNNVTIDTTAPTASVTTATLKNTANTVVQSSELGTAYLVNTAVMVNSLSDITGALDNQWNGVAISSANSNTNLAATGLVDGSYKVYTVDAAGNLSAVSGNTVTIDTTAPQVLAKTTGDILNSWNLSLTFNENVSAGSGNIVIHCVDDNSNVTIAVTDASQVSISGGTVTINPTANLLASATYYVLVDAGTFTDAAGNAFAGIGSTTGWAFTTASPLTTINVAGDADGNLKINSTELANLSLSGVAEGISGFANLSVKGITFHAIDNSGDISISTNLAVNAGTGAWTFANNSSWTSLLVSGKTYQVQVQVVDSTGTPVGVGTSTSSASYLVDTVAPTASATVATIMNTGNAIVQSTEVGTAYLVKSTVSVGSLADITGAANNQWNSVAIGSANSNTNLSASGLVDGSYQVYAVDAAGNLSGPSGNTVTIDTTAPTASATVATIMNTANAVVQSTEVGMAYLVNSNVNVASLTDITGAADNQWNSVAIGSANSNTNLAATGLADGSYKVYTVDAAGNLSAASSNTVTVDTTAPTASVTTATLMNTTNAVVRSTELGTAYLVNTDVIVSTLSDITAASGNQWNSTTVSATNSNTNLSASGLVDGSYKVYTVDAAGNLSGASSNTVTIDTTAPQVLAQTTGAILNTWNLSLTFSENVGVGSGNIVVHCVDDNSNRTIAVTDASQVSISGNTVTINPTSDLLASSSYYVLVDSGAFKDSAGNAFAGFSSTSDWVFTTASPVTTVNLSGDADSNFKINASELGNISVSGVAEGISGHANLSVTTITFHPSDNSGDIAIAANLAVNAGTGAWTLANNSSWTNQLVSGKTYQVVATMVDATSGINATGHGTSPGSYVVDTVAPTASVTAATLMNTANAVVQSTEVGTAYLVNVAINPHSITDITGAADNQWNSVAIGSANSNTSLAANGLADGVYKVYTVDAAGNLSLESSSTVTVDTTVPTLTRTYRKDENTASDTAQRTIALVGTDANGPLTWSNLGGTDAAFFALSGSTLTFQNTVNYEAKQSYSVTVTATDAAGNSSTQTLTIAVDDLNEAPTVVGSIANQNGAVGTAFTLNASAYFTDPDTVGVASNRTLTYALTSGTLPGGLLLNASTGVISGTPTGTAASGSYTVTATDGGGLNVSQTFNLEVFAAMPTVRAFNAQLVTHSSATGNSASAATTASVFSSTSSSNVGVTRNVNGTTWASTGYIAAPPVYEGLTFGNVNATQFGNANSSFGDGATGVADLFWYDPVTGTLKLTNHNNTAGNTTSSATGTLTTATAFPQAAVMGSGLVFQGGNNATLYGNNGAAFTNNTGTGGAALFWWDAATGTQTLINHTNAAGYTTYANITGGTVYAVSATGSGVLFQANNVSYLGNTATGLFTDLGAGITDFVWWEKATGTLKLVTHGAASINGSIGVSSGAGAPQLLAFAPEGQAALFMTINPQLYGNNGAPFVNSNLVNSWVLIWWDSATGRQYMVNHSARSNTESKSTSLTGSNMFNVGILPDASGAVFAQAYVNDLGNNGVWFTEASGATNKLLYWDKATQLLSLIDHSSLAGNTEAAITAASTLCFVAPDSSGVVFGNNNAAQFGNNGVAFSGSYGLFWWDKATGIQTLISHSSASGNLASASTNAVVAKGIANDSSGVVFESANATQFGNYDQAHSTAVPFTDAGTTMADLFWWNRNDGTQQLITHGKASNTGSLATAASAFDAIASDSSGVIFHNANATQFGNGGTGFTDAGTSAQDLFWWDKATGTQTLITHSAASSTASAATQNSTYVAALPDHSVIFKNNDATAFGNASGAFTDASTGVADYFLWDAATGTVRLLTEGTTAKASSGGAFTYNAVSADGNFLYLTTPNVSLLLGSDGINANTDADTTINDIVAVRLSLLDLVTASDNGASAYDNSTSLRNIQLNGFVNANETVLLRDNGTQVAAATADANGVAQFNLTAAAGTHVYTLYDANTGYQITLASGDLLSHAATLTVIGA